MWANRISSYSFETPSLAFTRGSTVSAAFVPCPVAIVESMTSWQREQMIAVYQMARQEAEQMLAPSGFQKRLQFSSN